MADSDSISAALFELSDNILEARLLLEAFETISGEVPVSPPLVDPHGWVWPLLRTVRRVEAAFHAYEHVLRSSKGGQDAAL